MEQTFDTIAFQKDISILKFGEQYHHYLDNKTPRALFMVIEQKTEYINYKFNNIFRQEQ